MKTEREILEPMPGFSREIGFYLSAMEEIRSRTRKVVEDLSDEENAQKVLPTAQPIGALVLHIGEAEFWWIQSIVADKEMNEEMHRIAHSNDWEKDDFAEKGYGTKYCIEAIDKISQMTREFLANLADEDLEKIHIVRKPDKEVHLNLRRILLHLSEHEAAHTGQISMLKRLLRESNN